MDDDEFLTWCVKVATGPDCKLSAAQLGRLYHLVGNASEAARWSCEHESFVAYGIEREVLELVSQARSRMMASQPINGSSRDFLAGFARCLAAVSRQNRQNRQSEMARWVMASYGIRIEHLQAAGVDPHDLELILKAVQ